MSSNPRTIFHCISLFALLALLTPTLNAQVVLDNSPLSGGLLAARAVREGRIQFQHGIAVKPSPMNLTCSPAPCVFPNVDASEGGSLPVNEHPLAVNPRNALQLLTGGNDYNCGNVQGFFATGDGGTTWTRVCSPGSGGEGHTVAAYDTNNNAFAGGLQFVGGVGTVVDFISTDNGAHWSTPITVIGAVFGYTADKPWMEADVNHGSPRVNTLYVSSTQFASNASDSQIWVSHSTDGGQTWAGVAAGALQHYTNLDQFSDLAIGADGTVYLNWLRCTANGPSNNCAGTVANIMFSKSTDGGATWSSEVAITTANLTPDPNFCCFYGALPVTSFERVSNIPSNAAFGSGATARVYVTYYNWTGTQMQVMSIASSDGGNTWDTPIRVTNATTGDEFFPWINVTPNGQIAATWLDRRNDPANIKYQPLIATSWRSGVSYNPSQALSSVQSDPTKDGFGGDFMGDYRTHVWDGRAVYANWMDTRTGVSQCEVGGAQF